MTSIRDAITRYIERADNQLSPYQLGEAVSWFLYERDAVDARQSDEVLDFVEAANAGVGYLHPKRLTGRALADAIVDRFNLNEGN